jgi:hypothetical protein
MVLYAAEVLRMVASPSVSHAVDAVEWAVGAVVALSVGDKILAFYRSLAAGKA